MNLSSLKISDTELISSKSHSRDGSAIQDILDHLASGIEPRHIYTDSLRVNGEAVQDSFEKYLSADALQSSHLKKALITPLHYAFSQDDDARALEDLEGEKGYFNIGTYLHQCILEPTLFSRAIVEPKFNLTTKEGVIQAIDFWKDMLYREMIAGEEYTKKNLPIGIEAFVEWQKLGLSMEKIDGQRAYLKLLKERSICTPVTEENFLKIKILKKHLDEYGSGIIHSLVKHSKREISFYTDLDGMAVKVRPDAIQFKENIGVDAIISIKSTACEDLRAFYTYCASRHYDLTESMYQDVVSQVTGREFRTTITIMLQTVEPYAIAIMVWSPDDIETGRYKYQSALEVIRKAKESGDYPGYEVIADNPFGLIEMKLPAWNGRELLPSE